MKRIIETFRVYEYRRVTEIDDKPSLAPMPASAVYDTTCDEVSTVRGPGVAKCQAPGNVAAAAARRRR